MEYNRKQNLMRNLVDVFVVALPTILSLTIFYLSGVPFERSPILAFFFGVGVVISCLTYITAVHDRI